MGKLNEQVGFIKDAIKHRQELDFTSYSRFLESAPIFITYYKQNTEESTMDYGTHNTQTFIGSDSSIRYNRIKEVPLYGLNMTQIDISEGETGITSSFESEGIMLPGTFSPIPNDYFQIDYMGKEIIFKVTNVVAGTIKSNDYIKIEFKFNQILEDHEQERLDKQVVSENTLILDNIGTDNKAIVSDDAYKRLDILKRLYEKLSGDYIDHFFVSEVNSFIVEYPVGIAERNDPAYNIYLTEFMIRHNLFGCEDSRENLYIELEVTPQRKFKADYNNSIFKSVEARYKYDIDKVLNHQFFNFINEQTSIFFERRTEYMCVELTPYKLPFYGPMLSWEIVRELADVDVIPYNMEYNMELPEANVGEDHYFSCEIVRPSKPIYNMQYELIQIIKNHLNHKKSVLTIDYMKTIMEYGHLNYDPDTFILLPLVLYIIQFEMNQIQHKEI